MPAVPVSAREARSGKLRASTDGGPACSRRGAFRVVSADSVEPDRREDGVISAARLPAADGDE
jgi:hypothetical protein